MPFPDSPRVIYKTNPLEEVICQLKFPPILRIESEPPAGFQDQLSGDYPILEDSPVAQLNLPPVLARLLGGDLSPVPQSRDYRFSSADGVWKVVLNREFIALSTSKYTRWDDFVARLEKALLALTSQYKSPSFFLRVGLRYRDVIRRSDFGNPDEHWANLLRPHILGELSDEGAEPNVLQAVRQTLIALPEGSGQVRLFHGLTAAAQASETCYSIDSDFFTESRTEAKDVFTVLKVFNRQAGRLFHWCITERLHNALGPEVVT
jgi:uncharacterized protein (TIGR04255 family)